MSIRTISQFLSSIPLLRHRDTVNPNLQADKDDFVIKYEATNDHLATTTVTEVNIIAEQINNTAEDINLVADEVEANAAIAQSIGNYQGAWNNTTAYLKNQSVSLGNSFFTAKANNTNISPLNTDYWLSNPINNKLNTNISTYNEKTTPINADLIPLCDSADAFAIKKLSWANLKTTLANLFVSKISTPTANALIKVNEDGSISNTSIVENNGNLGNGTQTFNGFGGSGFKNYIINGNFDVWQRGTSQTCTSAAFQYGSVDRFCLVNTEATNYTISRVSVDGTEPFSASYFARNVVPLNTANGIDFEQHIENLKRFSNKTVTLSMWVKGDAGKKIGFGYQTNYGSGGTPSAPDNILGKVFILTGSWQKVVMTTTLPDVITGKTYGANNDNFLRCIILFSSGSTTYVPEIFFQSGTFDIAQVQLEEGSVATPFEQRPYGLELSLCQRYYQKFRLGMHNGTTAPVTLGGSTTFKTQMRGVPTMGLLEGSGVNYQNVTAFGTEYHSTVPAGLWNVGLHYASAEL